LQQKVRADSALEKPTVQCFTDRDKGFVEVFREYSQELSKEVNGLSQLSAAPLKQFLFGNPTCRNSISHWEQKRDFTDRLVRYLVWFTRLDRKEYMVAFDKRFLLGCHQERWAWKLCPLLFMPRPEWLANSSSALSEIANFVSAFRNGSAIMVERGGKLRVLRGVLFSRRLDRA